MRIQAQWNPTPIEHMQFWFINSKFNFGWRVPCPCSFYPTISLKDIKRLFYTFGGCHCMPNDNIFALVLITVQFTPADKIPKSYYLKGRHVLSKNMESREVSRGSTLELQYPISRPGSLIRYNFVLILSSKCKKENIISTMLSTKSP